MPIQNALHTLSTAPEMIASGASATLSDKVSVLVSAPSATIFVGGPDVTAANGVAVTSSDTLSIDLLAGDSLFAIASTGTPTVRVMTTRHGYVAP
jgi:hypothetical protein